MVFRRGGYGNEYGLVVAQQKCKTAGENSREQAGGPETRRARQWSARGVQTEDPVEEGTKAVAGGGGRTASRRQNTKTR